MIAVLWARVYHAALHWAFTCEHIWNSASTKGKSLIRHKPSAAAITISSNNKCGLSFIVPFSLHPYQKSALNHSTHPNHFPLRHRLLSQAWSFLYGQESREETRKKKEKKKKERDPRGPIRLSFLLFGYAALPSFHSSGKLHSFPSEAHLDLNLRPCNAVPGSQW